MVLHGAGGAGRAGVLIEAGVQAPVGDAGGVLGAVRVDAAFHAQALLVGVALQARGAAAGRLVVG